MTKKVYLRNRSLFLLILFFLGLPLVAQTNSVAITFNASGLGSLTYNGVNFLSYGDLRLDQVTFQNGDGTTSTGSTSGTVNVDPVNQVQTRTYNWGTIAEGYSAVGNKLKISVIVTNQSSLPIQGIWFEPFGVQFSSTIPEFAAGYPLMVNTLGQPAVQMLTYSTGAMAIADDDVTKPLLLGFPNPVSGANATVPISLVTDRVGSYCGCFPTINRPIAAGATDTFNFSLRFGPTGSTATTLAPDIYQAFATDYPATLPVWPDHRAIGSIHLATNTLGLSGWTTNPRGFLMDPTVDVTTPAGITLLQQRMLSWANYEISILQNMNAQGMIAWDVEGEQFGPYNGDPTQLAALAPEMNPIADQWFQLFKNAGFRIGVTIRPQQLVIAPGLASVQQNFVADPTSILLAKAQYAHNRWGATLFYVDSNVSSWSNTNPIDPTIFQTLQAAMPDSLFFPEHSVTQYYAYSVPYLELKGGFPSTPAVDRFTYPNAYTLIYTPDGDVQGNFDALVSGVQQGDILLFRSWFDDEPANQQVQSIYQAAGKTATSITISINPLGSPVALGQPEQFTATVAGASNQQVAWSLAPGGVGTLSSSGLYVAPASATSQQSATIRATSVADPTKIASATVTFIPSLLISVSQPTTPLTASQTQQFSATISGTTNQQVTWRLFSGAGAISASGLYTAPATITAQQTATVQATSVADPTRTATAIVTLIPSAGVTLNPLSASLAAGGTQQFAAAVTGYTNQQVTWSLLAGGAGSISTSGLFTAPSTITTQQTVTVQATSVADPTKIATATVTLNPTVGISISPLTASLSGGQTQQFTPTVTGNANQQVTWGLLSGGVGSISASGLYTAPTTINAQQTVTVKATSAADSTKTATATITLNPTVGISISPLTTSLSAGQTQQFTPTVTGTANQQVTWTVLAGGAGTISASGLYTAPATINAQQMVKVQAASAADATKTTTATITLNPTVGISISPLTASLSGSQTQQFTPAITGTTNQQVTWTVLAGGAGSISTSGLYTAPASIPSQQTVTVQATSVADATKTATAAVTLSPTVGISVSPLTASLGGGQTQQFTPTITGATNQQVTWSLVGGGTVSSSGLYTAPSTITTQQTVTVKATSAADPTKTAIATVTLTPPAVPTCGSPSTNAFSGCYFNDITLGTTGGVAFSRVDPQINFTWNNISPGGSLGAYNYSVRWQGNFTFAAAPYTFTLSTDDGSRLYVDGNLVIDDWSVHPPQSISQSYTMSAGTHLIELDYFQAGGGATANLSWVNSAPPPAPTCGSAGTNAFTGCYFGDTTLGTTSGIAFSRIDPQINFDWSANGPGGSLGTSNYSVKWQGNFTFAAAPYTFTLSTDDGSRLYVDGQLLIDDWSTHAAYTITQSYTMTAGTHLIELDYFQAGGGATANLSWASAQQTVGISVNPTAASLPANQTQKFNAVVTGATNQQVTWTLPSGGPGTISSSGLYTAPSAISTQQTVTVEAISAADPTKTATASITLTPPVVNASCGAPSTNAFTGCYFGDTTLGASSGLAFSRIDPQINFDWSANGPGASLGTTNYSVKWQGNFNFVAGPYTFTLATDDGSRLYIDGQLVIDDWSAHAAYTINQSYTMTAGTHLIELDYFQAGGGATANLSWTAPAFCGTPSNNAFTGCYFNDTTLGTTGGLAFSRVDPQINFNWNNNAPGGALGLYNYSVRWQGNFAFNAGPHTFTLATDDGSRLYIDGQLVIDDWSVHAAQTISQSYTMSAGSHLVELDYFQAYGGATASLNWTPSP